MRKIVSIMCLVALSISIASVQAGSDNWCRDQLPSRLVIGKTGMVLPGPSNNVRSEPDVTGNLLGKIPALGEFTVLDGPVCNGEYVWWQVDYQGLQGWTVEGSLQDGYYLTSSENGNPQYYGENLDDNYTAIEQEDVKADAEDRFSFHGVSITIPDAIGKIDGRLYGPINPHNTEIPYFLQTPAHVSLTYDVGGEYYFEVEVFTTEAYDAYFPGAIAHLRDDLNNKPDTGIFLRDLWLMNAAIWMRARSGYVDTPWGAISHDLLVMGHSLQPVGNSYAYHAFGLTSDNRYFIRARSFTHIDMPHAIASAGDGREGQEYTDAILQSHKDGIAYLNIAAPEAFSPRIETLDSIVASIHIDPDTLSDQSIPQALIDFPRATPTPTNP